MRIEIYKILSHGGAFMKHFHPKISRTLQNFVGIHRSLSSVLLKSNILQNCENRNVWLKQAAGILRYGIKTFEDIPEKI